MARTEACLVDIYDTILSCDFAAHRAELPVLAGIPPEAWQRGYDRIDPDLNRGRLSKTEGFELILREHRAEPEPDLVQALVGKDRELLLATARLFDDALPFLESIRSRGIVLLPVPVVEPDGGTAQQARQPDGVLGCVGQVFYDRDKSENTS